jgi:transcriptional regulator with XRE-family HTH domain
LVSELTETRRILSLSQQSLADALGRSQSEVSRLERHVDVDRVSLVTISEVASVLGLELSVGLHPAGEPIRDKGHQALIRRFRAQLSPAWRVLAEAPLPTPGDRRYWDLLLRIPAQLVGVEAETRIRDMQRLVRHMNERERDGGADVVLLLLAATRTNRALVDELRTALGSVNPPSARTLLGCLRAGVPLPGSGVVLL